MSTYAGSSDWFMATAVPAQPPYGGVRPEASARLQPRRLDDLKANWPEVLAAMITAAVVLMIVILYLINRDTNSAMNEIFMHFSQQGRQAPPDGTNLYNTIAPR